jgi:hypothetical protein
MASIARHHADWLRLVETSGPFLSMPVLLRAFPQGLERHEPEVRAELADAYGQWLERGRHRRGDHRAVHRQFIHHVLTRTLGLPESLLLEGQALPGNLNVPVREHCEVLSPHWALVNPQGREGAGAARLLVRWYEDGQGLEKALAGERWVASPVSRMVELLRAANVRLGLVTNGEHWVLVHAPRGETSGTASFFAHLWQEEKVTLQAFRSLLGVERFFNQPDSDTLEGLLAESAHDQQEVTDQLGFQVRRAVELLIKALDRIDRDRGRKLLAGVSEREAYEAAVSVMMRLVFLFCAEERGLLMLGDPLFDAGYAVSTLRDQLREVEDLRGAEVMQRRHDAWARLLAVFRAVHGGVQHEAMRLPGYGGSLFDPDRFPFLEGRKKGTRWREQAADPLPIDNHTVLQLLEALQLLQVKVPGGVETRRLSFRALDVEQIGHIYEGLLDHTATRAAGPVLGLVGAKGQEPEVPLARLEDLRAKGSEALVEALADETGKSSKAIQKAVQYEEIDEAAGLLRACEHDEALYERVRPFAGLVREDESEHPVVILDGSLYVTQGTDRRTTGTHYTPRSLTEEVVRYALEPLVYVGPAEGKPAQEWKLRSAKEILGLKICDFAMGSGAFLVQACRHLSERLVEAWDEAERSAQGRLVVTPEGELSTGAPSERPLPRDTEERLAIARRIVADRCLFGVDKNPMAVEMAKLSLWLVTLQKNRPFTFVDHALRAGDSLLGVTEIRQVEHFDLSGEHGGTRIAQRCRAAVRAALDCRRRLESFTVETPKDVERKQALLVEAQRGLADVRLIADLLIGAVLKNKGDALAEELERIVQRLEHVMDPAAPEENRARFLPELRALAEESLGERAPLHWPLEFPEVFERDGANGFDAIAGNPPFLGGKKITGPLGTDYREYLVEHVASGRTGHADLCAYFFLRAGRLLRSGGTFGLLATNTIAQGDTREVGLEQLPSSGCSILRAVPSRKWPGDANLEVAYVWARKGTWAGEFRLEDKPVAGITPFLAAPGAVLGKPFRLKANEGKSFIGSYVLGLGFVLSPEEAQALTEKDPRNKEVLFPYLNGEDLNSRPDQSASRWVINFRDWPLDRETAPEGYEGPVAADYPDCHAIIEARVRDERQRRKADGSFVLRNPLPQRYWQYADKRPGLYAAIAGTGRVLLKSEVGNRVSFAWSPSESVFSHMLIVFATEEDADFGVLQCSIHEAWARAYGSSMRTDLRYTSSDCFDTFPFPGRSRLSAVESVARRYDQERGRVMRGRSEGLTKLYARFGDEKCRENEIRNLRELHIELDITVAAAYGWTDLKLGHGFHDTKQGARFSVSQDARHEILARLLQLNRERYREEVGRGLHEKKMGSATSRAPRARMAHPTLFDLSAYTSRRPEQVVAGPSAEIPRGAPAGALLQSLQEAGTALAKSDLLSRSGVAESDWASAIKSLMEAGRVVQKGKGRATKYTLAERPGVG